MKRLTLKEVQTALLGLLTEFDRVCREHGLRYSLAYGTLLGAVRHGGFIPWDDDADVLMPRPDYEKFHALAEEGKIVFPSDFALTRDRGKRVDYPFLKLMDKRYRIKSASHVEVPYLFLDIFPVDGVPDLPPKERKKLYHRERFWNFINAMCRWYVFADKWWGYVLRVPLFWFYLPWICYGKTRASRRLKKILELYPYEECELCDCRAWGQRCDDIPRALYDDLREYDFEGHKFFGYADYDTALSVCYHDYMTIPDEKHRGTHHLRVYPVPKA